MEVHDQEFQPSTRQELRPKRQLVQEQQEHEEKQQQQQQHNVSTGVPLGLKIKIPSYNKEVVVELGEKKLDDDDDDDSDNDGFRTPTSQEHKIQVILPPAPRKPKPRPSTKRKGSCQPQILLDLSQVEIESLFSSTPPFAAMDLFPAGGKINNKKLKLQFTTQ